MLRVCPWILAVTNVKLAYFGKTGKLDDTWKYVERTHFSDLHEDYRYGKENFGRETYTSNTEANLIQVWRFCQYWTRGE